VEPNEIISSGLLELYAAGLASQEEAAQVLQYAAQYPEVADELAQIEASLALYARANALQPGASVKQKVFERINGGEGAKVVPLTNTKDSYMPAPRISSGWKMVAAAAILLLVASAAMNILLYNKSSEKDTVLSEKERILKESLAINDSLQQRDKALGNYIDVARDPESRSVSINVANAPDSNAKVFWMPKNGDVYVDPSNLPALPGDKQYELWAIIDGVPVNAGIIVTTKQGNSYKVQRMKGFGAVKVQAFAVSIEPASTKAAEKPTVVYAVGPTI